MKKITLQATIPEECATMRVDQALAKLFPDYSRSTLQNWIKADFVRIDGKAPTQKTKVNSGQEVIIHAILENFDQRNVPENIPLDIIFEDDDLLVINKPAGLVVHPGAGNLQHTLMNALLHHAPELTHLPRAGIVHRLDKDTSGLLVIAKNLASHHSLIKQLQQREVQRVYQAIANGLIISGATISERIGRHPRQRLKMAVISAGKEAITEYRVLEKFRAHTLIKVQLQTGRTHQIRVHMAHIHHPIVGDQLYGGRFKLPAKISPELKTALQHFKRQALHAWQLSLIHPRTKDKMSWKAEIPEDMQNLIGLMRKDCCHV